MYSTFKTALISIVGMLIVLMAPACQEGVSPGTGGKPDQPTGVRPNAVGDRHRHIIGSE